MCAARSDAGSGAVRDFDFARVSRRNFHYLTGGRPALYQSRRSSIGREGLWTFKYVARCPRGAGRPTVSPGWSGRSRSSRPRRRRSCVPAWCASSRARGPTGTLIRLARHYSWCRAPAGCNLGRQSARDQGRRRGLDSAEREALHGAAPTTNMVHVAMQEALDGKHVTWMEPVTDEQYKTAP